MSDASIKRVSESVQTVQSIITQADREAFVKRPSDKHERVDSTSDVRALVEVLHQEVDSCTTVPRQSICTLGYEQTLRLDDRLP